MEHKKLIDSIIEMIEVKTLTAKTKAEYSGEPLQIHNEHDEQTQGTQKNNAQPLPPSSENSIEDHQPKDTYQKGPTPTLKNMSNGRLAREGSRRERREGE